MAKDTKERILAKALEQFSQKGYERTNVKEIMVSLGLVKSAMYRHFESKEEIWNTLLDRLIAYYEERFGWTRDCCAGMILRCLLSPIRLPFPH